MIILKIYPLQDYKIELSGVYSCTVLENSLYLNLSLSDFFNEVWDKVGNLKYFSDNLSCLSYTNYFSAIDLKYYFFCDVPNFPVVMSVYELSIRFC